MVMVLINGRHQERCGNANASEFDVYSMSKKNFPLSVKIAYFLQTKKAASGAIDAKWNTPLRELSKQGLYSQALILYGQMMRSGATLNAFTFPFVLKSSSALSLKLSGTQIHCRIVKSGCHSEPFIQTALISMYCRFSLVDHAYNVFDESPEARRLTVCYNALISG